MTYTRPIRIFISSTAEDFNDKLDISSKSIIDRIQEVIVTAADAAEIDCEVKFFSSEGSDNASGESPSVQWCLKNSGEWADLVIVLSARRYGWIPTRADWPDADGYKSITWMETDAAKKAGKYVLFYRLKDGFPWRYGASAPPEPPDARSKLDHFLRTMEKPLIGFFESEKDLVAQIGKNVAQAMRQLGKARPRIEGRDEELSRLFAMVSGPDELRFALLYGQQYSGRSALACHAATSLALSQGLTFVEWDCSGGSAEDVARGLLAQLPLASGAKEGLRHDDPQEALYQATAQTPISVVLKNVAAPEILELALYGFAQGCYVFVTSLDEKLADELGLLESHRLAVKRLDRDTAARYFAFLVPDASPSQIAEVVDEIGTLPGVLAMLAGTIRKSRNPGRELIEWMARFRADRKAGLVQDPVLRLIEDRLSAVGHQEARLLERLAVFGSGTFTPELAAVTDQSDLWGSSLQNLERDGALLSVDGSWDGTKFLRLDPLLRPRLERRLRDKSEYEVVFDRVLDRVEQAVVAAGQSPSLAELLRKTQELVFRAANRKLNTEESPDKSFWRGFEEFLRFTTDRDAAYEVITRYQRKYQSEYPTDPGYEVALWLGYRYLAIRRPEPAVRLFREAKSKAFGRIPAMTSAAHGLARALFESAPADAHAAREVLRQALAELDAAFTYCDSNIRIRNSESGVVDIDPASRRKSSVQATAAEISLRMKETWRRQYARQNASRSLEAERNWGTPDGLIRSLEVSARVQAADHDYTNALVSVDEAIRLCERSLHRAQLTRLWAIKAGFYSEQGMYEDSRRCLEHAIKLAGARGDDLAEAEALIALGALFEEASDPAEARETFNRASRKSKRDLGLRILAVFGRGRAELALGAYEDARDSFSELEGLKQEIGGREGRAEGLESVLRIMLVRRAGDTEALSLLVSSIDNRVFEFVSESEGASRIRLLRYAAAVHLAYRKFPEAAERYMSALDLARSEGRRALEGLLLQDLARLHEQCRQFAEAVDYLTSAERVYAAIGGRTGQIAALHQRALVETRKGRFRESRTLLTNALDMAQSAKNRRSEAMLLTSLSKLFHKNGEFEIALAYLKRSEAIERTLDAEGLGLARTLTALANLQLEMKQYAAARRTVDAALLLERNLRNARGQAVLLNQRAQIALRSEGELALSDVLADVEQSLKIADGIGDLRHRAYVLLTRARLYKRAGRDEDALNDTRESRTIGERLNSPMQAALALQAEAELLAKKDPASAVEAAENAVMKAQESGDDYTLHMAHQLLSRLLIDSGRIEGAIDELKERGAPVAARLAEAGSHSAATSHATTLARALKLRGDADAAAAQIRAALSRSERHGQSRDIARLHLSLAELLVDRDMQCASKHFVEAAEQYQRNDEALPLNLLQGLNTVVAPEIARVLLQNEIGKRREKRDWRKVCVAYGYLLDLLTRTDAEEEAQFLIEQWRIDSDRGGDAVKGDFLISSAWWHYIHKRPHDAMGEILEALSINERLGVLINLQRVEKALSTLIRDDPSLGAHHLDRPLELRRKEKDHRGCAELLLRRGQLHARSKNHLAALGDFKESLLLAERTGLAYLAANIEYWAANAHRDLGDWRTALECCERCLDGRRFENTSAGRRGLANGFRLKAQILREWASDGNGIDAAEAERMLGEAEQLLRASISILEAEDLPADCTDSLITLGATLRQLRRHDQAVDVLVRARELWQQSGTPAQMKRIVKTLAHCFQDLKRETEALEELNLVLADSASSGDVTLLETRGEIYTKLQRFPEAEADLRRVLDDPATNTITQLKALHALGQIYKRTFQYKKALDILRRRERDLASLSRNDRKRSTFIAYLRTLIQLASVHALLGNFGMCAETVAEGLARLRARRREVSDSYAKLELEFLNTGISGLVEEMQWDQVERQCTGILNDSTYSPLDLVVTWNILGDSRQRQRRYSDAQQAFERAIELAMNSDPHASIRSQSIIYPRMIRTLIALDAVDDAEALIPRAIEVANLARRSEDKCRVLISRAALSLGRGQPHSTLPLLIEAESIAMAMGDVEQLIEIASLYERAYSSMGDDLKTAEAKARLDSLTTELRSRGGAAAVVST